MSLFKTNPAQLVKLYQIAAMLKKAKLSDRFITSAVKLAEEYEGAFDLLVLWEEEKDKNERANIIADLQDEIDEFAEQPKEPTKKAYISFDDLEQIAKDVKGFKAHLKALVDQWGGVTKLAGATGIPQPSLSRFFNSVTMPRRTTLYKIANAIGATEKEIITDWAA